VGHEQDEPLCDLAADVRAPTPTAAARLVVPDLDELRAGLDRARQRLDAGTRRALERDRGRLARSRERLTAAPGLLLERRRAALDRASARLQALSPRATLARGYAIVRTADGVLRDAAVVAEGDRVEVELARGGLGARVEEVRP
jgi:exodeoxyribonuclease VII large subunit